MSCQRNSERQEGGREEERTEECCCFEQPCKWDHHCTGHASRHATMSQPNHHLSLSLPLPCTKQNLQLQSHPKTPFSCRNAIEIGDVPDRGEVSSAGSERDKRGEREERRGRGQWNSRKRRRRPGFSCEQECQPCEECKNVKCKCQMFYTSQMQNIGLPAHAHRKTCFVTRLLSRVTQ